MLFQSAIRIRAAFRLGRLVLHLFWGVLTAATVFRWLPEGAQRWIKARWSRQLLEELGVRIVEQGASPSRGLLVANHISWLDIFAINALAPTTFLSKDDVLHWPVIGWLSKQVGTLFLERGSRAAAQRAREHLTEALQNGALVGVFPEGTTGFGDHVMPFHAALFQSAIDAEAAVMPTLIRYTDRSGTPSLAAAYVGETSLWQCMRSIVRASGLTVHVAFLPALQAKAADRRHLAHHAHQTIGAALARSSPNLPVSPVASMEAGIPAGLPAEPPSNSRPTDSPNPAPADFPAA